MSDGRYPIVVFDLDGTLLQGTSVSLFLAEWMGKGPTIAALEQRFRSGEISNRVVADTSASWFAGLARDDVWQALERAPWIAGIDETFAALSRAGCTLLLGTVTWRFAGEMLQERYPLAAVCGTEMDVERTTLRGRVRRYFDEHDKLQFVDRWSSAHGYALRDVAAVGDSRSDVPLFNRVGCAIALNATPDARAAADHEIDTDDLTDVLPLLLDSAATQATVR